MKSLELFDISATLSEKLTEWSPLYNKVTKVIDAKTFEMARSENNVLPKDFWEHDRHNRIISAKQKARIHLQYHRSKDIYGNVFAFVHALKALCDSGLPLFHEGIPVVDLWVLSTAEFDVSDLFDSKVLWLTDPASGYTLPSLSTYENMETLRGLGSDVSRNLGLFPTDPDEVAKKLKTRRPDAYHGVMPHVWVAAIIEDERIGGGKGRRMVHIDICAAAFDDGGIVKHNGSWVSLKTFTTPEYNLVTTENLGRALRLQVFGRGKLIMQPGARPTDGQWQFPMLNFMPSSIRHFRCFDKIDGSYIEMTPVERFVERGNHRLPGDKDAWSTIVSQIRHNILAQVPIGAKVLICNLLQRPELNGESGRVLKHHPTTRSRNKKKRIYVCVPRVDHPVGLKTNCFLLPTRKQYSCLEDIVKKEEEMRYAFDVAEDEVRPISKGIEDKLATTIKEDRNLRLAFEVLTAGKLTILSFTDSAFVQGVRKLLSVPLNQILSTPYYRFLRTGLEIVHRPQGAEALKILKLVKMSKQKVFEKEPSMMRGDGSILLDEGSDFQQLMKRVKEKILSDKGLKTTFELMDEQGLFPFSTWV